MNPRFLLILPALALLRIAPAGGEPEGPPAAPSERRLHIAQVEASSFLWNDWNKFQENYHPLYLADDDPATAWVEGAPGPGVGEWVRLKVTPMDGASRVRLRLRNGYQKSDALFAANGRIKDLTVRLLPGGKTQKAALRDEKGWQELIVEQPSGPLVEIELKVNAVYPGRRYEDLCLSDVQVFVTALTRENPAFEKSRLDKILAWKQERKKAAQLFKSETAREMPVGPQYTVKEAEKGVEADRQCTEDDPFCSAAAAISVLEKGEKRPEWLAAMSLGRAAIAGGFKDFVPVQAVALDKRPLPKVDGLCTPDLNNCFDGGGCYGNVELSIGGTLGFLNAAQVGIFSVKEQPTIARVVKAAPRECKQKDAGKMFAWAKMETGRVGEANKETLRALVLVRCGAVEGREGMVPTAMPQLLVYGKDGRLALVAGRTYASTLNFRERPEGPVLAAGRRANSYGDPLLDLAEATSLARK